MWPRPTFNFGHRGVSAVLQCGRRCSRDSILSKFGRRSTMLLRLQRHIFQVPSHSAPATALTTTTCPLAISPSVRLQLESCSPHRPREPAPSYRQTMRPGCWINCHLLSKTPLASTFFRPAVRERWAAWLRQHLQFMARRRPISPSLGFAGDLSLWPARGRWY